MDFYRELGDLFSLPLHSHNRWAGFKTLRARWAEHITSTLSRPVLIIDEAQEALTTVLSELRVLASKDLDSRQLLCVVVAGDARLVERVRTTDDLKADTGKGKSRNRPRNPCSFLHARCWPGANAADVAWFTVLEYASRDELLACLDHLLETAGNPTLMTTELKATLADHAAGNYRVLMNLGDELLALAADKDLPRLDEKLFLEAFNQQPRPTAKAPAKRR